MSEKREELLTAAERLFHSEGFFATGIDRVIAEADVARMTLYKHFPSKDDLVLAVLARRETAYWEQLTVEVERAGKRGQSGVLALFVASGRWLRREAPHGCLFMKALGEYAGHSPRIAAKVADHKRRILDWLRALLAAEGYARSRKLEVPLMLLLEGATACAQVLSPADAARHAHATAAALLAASPARTAAAALPATSPARTAAAALPAPSHARSAAAVLQAPSSAQTSRKRARAVPAGVKA